MLWMGWSLGVLRSEFLLLCFSTQWAVSWVKEAEVILADGE